MTADPATASSASPAVDGVPCVDLSDYVDGDAEQQVAFIAAVGDALRRHGFVRVTGHGIDGSVVEPACAAARALFALPDATKRRYVRAPGYERGYTPFGVEHAKDEPTPDLKEFWHVGRELDLDHPLGRVYPPNPWPREVSDFRGPMMSLYRRLENTAMVLLEALAEYLEEPADTFTSLAREGNSILRVLHYPPIGGKSAAKGAVRATAHEDVNFITLLIHSTASGLELRTRDGTWRPVQAEPGEIIVDVGDMMGRMTNGVLAATTHRVVNPDDDTDRYCLPFFVHPRPDAVLEALPSCVGEGFPTPQPAITGYAFLLQRLRQLGLADDDDEDA